MKWKHALTLALLPLFTMSAQANAADAKSISSALRHSGNVPVTVSDADRARFRAAMQAIRDERWSEATAAIAGMDDKDSLRNFARAELYTARNSPKTELFDLLDLISKAPHLPRADQLRRMAEKRGATALPDLPQVQKLAWFKGAPRRETLSATKEQAAEALAARILPLIKADNPAGAESELIAAEASLSPEAVTEWRARVGWSYYIENDDTNARRLAARAQLGGTGPWLTQAYWTTGLAAWRSNDCAAAATAFNWVVSTAVDDDMRAAGAYWAARSHMACGEPGKVQPFMRTAAQYDETFYGLLARESLGMTLAPAHVAMQTTSDDWNGLRNLPNIRIAVALVEIGDDVLADEVLKHQARLNGGTHHEPLLRLARELSLPTTQIWLAHNGPQGRRPDSSARYPAPSWSPDGGWRVDKALVFAHALQESGFRANVISPAGARGLMQVMPGTARLMANRTGEVVSPDALNTPSTNMEYGQRYLETLRDTGATGGLLPKVMAAYNAGPTPVERWNTQIKDKGDPLLFIESIPYYETRAYVTIVMRNYWMYQAQEGRKVDSLSTMAQGLWPRFPGLSGKSGVRVTANTVTGARSE